jgi:hypothetical protein
MSRKICDAANGIALDFDIGRHHLADQWRQAAKLDDGDLVLGWRLLEV